MADQYGIHQGDSGGSETDLPDAVMLPLCHIWQNRRGTGEITFPLVNDSLQN